MTQYSIKRYSPEQKTIWDRFIPTAKNGSFLFYRDFMDYHADRFNDYSLLLFKDEKLVAVLPANFMDNTIYSYQGLTYGGLILSKKLKFQEVFGLFQELLKYLGNNGIAFLEIKNIPSFYNPIPAEEIDYLYFLLKAMCVRTDIASVINLQSPLPIQKNRMEGVKKAVKKGLKIDKTDQFSGFWNTILIPNLANTHKAQPVHSVEEIILLQQRFPKNIHQFNVLDKENKIVAGATIFETQHVAHVQYISGNEDKQQLGSLDFLFHQLITQTYSHKNYFDFGTSNENGGKNLNKGLQYWKEGFGARSFACRSHRISTANHGLLDSVLI